MPIHWITSLSVSPLSVPNGVITDLLWSTTTWTKSFDPKALSQHGLIRAGAGAGGAVGWRGHARQRRTWLRVSSLSQAHGLGLPFGPWGQRGPFEVEKLYEPKKCEVPQNHSRTCSFGELSAFSGQEKGAVWALTALSSSQPNTQKHVANHNLVLGF